MKSFAQIKAIEKKNKERILKVCPAASEECGIYIMAREENGFRYAYVGQAEHLLTRLAQHLSGYQHIDLSIRKHGLYSEDNITGWQIVIAEYCFKSQLDFYEQKYIKEYADRGFQLRNKTSGGQGNGKVGIAENKPAKGYYDGLKQGYENARRDIKKLFNKQLEAGYKDIDVANGDKEPGKNQYKAMQKFREFIED